MAAGAHTPGPWALYVCSFADQDTRGTRACGLNGQSFDYSTDECHHPLTRADGVLIASAPDLLAERDRYKAALENIAVNSMWTARDTARAALRREETR